MYGKLEKMSVIHASEKGGRGHNETRRRALSLVQEAVHFVMSSSDIAEQKRVSTDYVFAWIGLLSSLRILQYTTKTLIVFDYEQIARNSIE
jgi:hypothetical protein